MSTQSQLSTEVSKEFWENQIYYPTYGNVIKKRRLEEATYLTSWIWSINAKSLTDIGCGNGSTVTMLQELTDIEKYECYDISANMLNAIDTRGLRTAKINTSQLDLCTVDKDFPETDLTTILGVHMYLTDEQIANVMSHVKSKLVILRDPTSETHEEINKYSEELGANYSAVYRTVDEYITLYNSIGYRVKSVSRAFSDDIESKFGTKQYFFVCERK